MGRHVTFCCVYVQIHLYSVITSSRALRILWLAFACFKLEFTTINFDPFNNHMIRPFKTKGFKSFVQLAIRKNIYLRKNLNSPNNYLFISSKLVKPFCNIERLLSVQLTIQQIHIQFTIKTD